MIPAPKALHPDFRTPRRRPTGPVDIDWSNPLSKGLAGVVLYGTYTVVELVHKTTWKMLAPAWAFQAEGDTFGMGADATANLYQNDGVKFSENGLDTYTFLTVNRQISGDQYDLITVLNRDGEWSGKPCIYSKNGGQAEVRDTDDSTEGWGTYSAATGRKTVTGANVNAGVPDGVYIDGRRQATFAGSQSNLTGMKYICAGFTIGYDPGLTVYEMDVVWNRELSAAEHMAFWNDPYQILRPALPEPLLLATAATLFIRPDADDTDGNWVNELNSNVNLFASIDEVAASDADYIRSASRPAADKCKVRLSDPSGVRDTSSAHVLKYRYYKQGDDVIDLTVRLVQGASTVIATWTHSGIGASVVEASQTLTAPQVASITNDTDLYLEFEADAP